MSFIKKLFLLIMISCTFPDLFSQFFDYGQDPGSVKWRQMNTDNFKIIFPDDYSDQARKVSFYLEDSYKKNAQQLNHNPRKIPVVIHNQSVVSNGFVGIAPKRMELFVQPDTDGYPGERLYQLSIHEMRHVTQVDKLNKGFTRFLSVIFGEQGNGIAAAMTPFWLLEGDAVFAETDLTLTGRGRLPFFEKEIKAILADQKNFYSYDKSYLGSYKDFVPDYYRYGYQMTAFGNDKYGVDFWGNAFSYIGKKSWQISPLSFYLKKETGLNTRDFYNEAMGFIGNHWETTAKKRRIDDYRLLGEKIKVYTSYKFPAIQNSQEIIAVKSGLDIIPHFVKIFPDESEEKLFTPGQLNSGKFSVHNNKIIWDQYQPDIRWSNRSFSIIKEYNIETKSVRTLTYTSRYASPTFSSTGDTITVIENTPEGETYLVLISSYSGDVITKIQSPSNSSLQSPQWIEGTSSIAVIALNEEGKTILRFDPAVKGWTELFHSGYVDIHNLSSKGDYLFFQGAFEGIDDIYMLNINNNELFRVTFSEFGAYYPSVAPEGDELAFSLYTGNGYKLSKISLDDLKKEKVDIHNTEAFEQTFFNTSSDAKQAGYIPAITENFNPEIKRYSRLSNLFRFHSWLPFYFDYTNLSPESYQINPGLSLTSQNTLSTAFTSIGYEYKDNDHYFHSSFTYKGFYPVIKFSADYGGKPLIFKAQDDPNPLLVGRNMYYNLLTYIPLNLTSGKMITGVQPTMRLSYSGNYYYYKSESAYKQGIIFTEPRLYFYTFLRRAHRDLQPKWGLVIDGRVLAAPFEEEQLGSISSLSSLVYFPGILRNHGLKLQAQFQKQEPEKYLFNNLIRFPRGYNNLVSIGLRKYTADYIFPIAYPDFRIGSLFYIKSVYASLFADYSQGKGVYETINNNRVVSDKSFYSYGTEIYFEYHIFRLILPLIQGIRVSYLQEKQTFTFEGIFRIDLDRF